MDNIGIVDYGMGNIKSVANAVYEQGYDPIVVADESQFAQCSHLILPGVGHFQQAMNNIKERRLDVLLKTHAIELEKPLLGICLGMQLLLSESEEGECRGLDFVPGKATLFDKSKLRVPHVGWNEVKNVKSHPVLSETKNDTDFYFVHSYFCQTDTPEHTLAETEYGHRYASIIGKNNIIGAQFHPEKSQVNGLSIIEQFCEWDGQC